VLIAHHLLLNAQCSLLPTHTLATLHYRDVKIITFLDAQPNSIMDCLDENNMHDAFEKASNSLDD